LLGKLPAVIDVAAIVVSLLAGFWLVLVGLFMLFQPERALRALAMFGSTPLLHFSELGLRMLAGLALVIAGPFSRLPEFLVPAGWFIALSSVVLMLLPRAWHAAYATWWSERFSISAVRGLGPVACLAGAALIFILALAFPARLAGFCDATQSDVLTQACRFPGSLPGQEQTGADVSGADVIEARTVELSIATGRYGVMLAQAREILGLKEPAGLSVAAPAASTVQELQGIADQQAAIARELLADTRLACSRPDVPAAARELACAVERDMPPGLQRPIAPAVDAISDRDAALGSLVMRWWAGVCALAPQVHADEPPACAIE
jgi:hypothetical protein